MRRSRLPSVLVLVASLLVPNVATVVGGFHGFFLTYLAWSALIVIAVPLLARGGRGSLSASDSVLLGVALALGLSALGLFLGFDSRRYPADPASLSISLSLFLINTLGVEVGRSAAMGLSKRPPIRIALGTACGVVLGSTVPAFLSYASGVYGRPLTLLADLLYSLTLAAVHEHGGLVSGILFRTVVDGYWRFSPLVLTSATPAVLRSAILALAYYAILTLVLAMVRGLRGSSREVLELGYAKRVLRMLPELLSLSLALSFLLLAFGRFVPLVVTSGSMYPTISVGDVVFVHATGGAGVGVGDVVAYVMEGRQVVVHRVVAVGPDWVRTKGDANPDPDPFLVSYGNILGRVVLVVPMVGLVAIALQAGGWVTYLPLALLSVGALSAVYLRRHARSRKLKFSLIK